MTADMAKYVRERRAGLVEEAREKLGGKCAGCGSTGKLQFDHIDPKTKIAVVINLATKAPEHFWAEVAKCQLLCLPCHQLKSILERGNLPVGERHGSLTYAIKFKCKCDPCRIVKRDAMRRWRAKKAEVADKQVP